MTAAPRGKTRTWLAVLDAVLELFIEGRPDPFARGDRAAIRRLAPVGVPVPRRRARISCTPRSSVTWSASGRCSRSMRSARGRLRSESRISSRPGCGFTRRSRRPRGRRRPATRMRDNSRPARSSRRASTRGAGCCASSCPGTSRPNLPRSAAREAILAAADALTQIETIDWYLVDGGYTLTQTKDALTTGLQRLLTPATARRDTNASDP